MTANSFGLLWNQAKQGDTVAWSVIIYPDKYDPLRSKTKCRESGEYTLDEKLGYYLEKHGRKLKARIFKESKSKDRKRVRLAIFAIMSGLKA